LAPGFEAANTEALRGSIHNFATVMWDEDPEWQ
jgi:hypothetical protein